MAYTTIKKPSDYFNTKLYTGDGSSSRSITGVNFQPDWTWVKSRNSADYDHMVTDVVRGTPKMLKTNSTAAEDANPGAGGIGSFDSDGFTISTGSINNTNMNNNGTTYVGWNWLANGAGSANTDGSISSTVSASATSGFSVVKFTGTGSAGTIGHGLGSAPKMIILKNASINSNWIIYHTGLTSYDYRVNLDGTGAETNSEGNTYWTADPTSSLFSIGTNSRINGSGNSIIAYCFADKQGYSKFGSYTGNGSTDGTFVYTGFKPAFIMIKETTNASNWTLYDNKRAGFNSKSDFLYANTSAAEDTSNTIWLDMLSNGFKILEANNLVNRSGGNYIYMAFAEAPLVGDNPATAR